MDFLHITRVACFTFLQAACSTLLALFIGLPLGFFCGRRNFPGRKFLLSLSAIPFCMPSLLIALGYVTFLGVNGHLNHFLMFAFGFKKPPVRILYSFAGLVIAHGFYNFPLIMKNLSSAWERLPSESAESARLLGAGEGRIFFTVTLSQLMPSIASSSLLVFIYSFLSFVLVLLFGGIGNSTLEVEIYKAARASLDFKTLAILACIETFILILVTVFYTVLEEKTSGLKWGSSEIWKARKPLKGFTEISSFFLIFLLIFVFFLAPLLGIVFNAFSQNRGMSGSGKIIFSLAAFKRILKMKTFWPSVISTVKTALLTGFFCTLLGFLYSVFLIFCERKEKSKFYIILKIIPMLPMAISSVVTGVIIIMIVKKGSAALLVVAQTLLTWPLAWKVIYPHLSKINKDTMDSGLLLSKNRLDMTFRLLLPFCLPALLNAFGFCFAISAGDTTLPLVLAIPKFETLSLFTYRLAGAYRFNEACAAGLVLALICGLVFVLSLGFRKKSD